MKLATGKCLQGMALLPCFFPSIAVTMEEMLSVLSCRRISFLPFLLGFLLLLTLKVNSVSGNVGTALLPALASTQNRQTPSRLSHSLPWLERCHSALKQSPSMPGVCFGNVPVIHHVSQISTPHTLFRPFAIRNAPGKRLCRKEGPTSFSSKAGWAEDRPRNVLGDQKTGGSPGWSVAALCR